jgi:hypothetical protein
VRQSALSRDRSRSRYFFGGIISATNVLALSLAPNEKLWLIGIVSVP